MRIVQKGGASITALKHKELQFIINFYQVKRKVINPKTKRAFPLLMHPRLMFLRGGQAAESEGSKNISP